MKTEFTEIRSKREYDRFCNNYYFLGGILHEEARVSVPYSNMVISFKKLTKNILKKLMKEELCDRVSNTDISSYRDLNKLFTISKEWIEEVGLAEEVNIYTPPASSGGYTDVSHTESSKPTEKELNLDNIIHIQYHHSSDTDSCGYNHGGESLRTIIYLNGVRLEDLEKRYKYIIDKKIEHEKWKNFVL